MLAGLRPDRAEPPRRDARAKRQGEESVPGAAAERHLLPHIAGRRRSRGNCQERQDRPLRGPLDLVPGQHDGDRGCQHHQVDMLVRPVLDGQ